MNQTTKEVQTIISNLDQTSQLQFKLGYETREAEEQEGFRQGFRQGVRRAVEFLCIAEGVHDTMSHDKLYKSVLEQCRIQKGGI